jgi:hypothetical protein
MWHSLECTLFAYSTFSILSKHLMIIQDICQITNSLGSSQQLDDMLTLKGSSE